MLMRTGSPTIALLAPFLGILLAMAVLSCDGDGVGLNGNGDPIVIDPGYAELIQPLFDKHCVRCHAPGASGYNATGGDLGGGLNLTSGSSYASLVAHPTFELPADPPRWRVLAGEPDSSYVLQKVVSATPKNGSRMPLDGPPFLSTSEIQVLTDWIADGAPGD